MSSAGVQRFLASKRISNPSETLNRVYALGGSISEIGGYRIHVFSSSTVIDFSGTGNVEYLVVAGGGGTGWDVGGGGGGGGLIYKTNMSVLKQTYPVTVGMGGASAIANATSGSDGQNSSFNGDTAIGGGGGGTYNGTQNGRSGGSGGGGASTSGAGGSGTAGQGNNGGAGATGNYGSGGGGGAGGAGAAGVTNTAVLGGASLTYSISGSSAKYSGGGYGSMDSTTIYPSGYDIGNNFLGTYGFGSNGAGSGVGYTACQGVVIVRYLL